MNFIIWICYTIMLIYFDTKKRLFFHMKTMHGGIKKDLYNKQDLYNLVRRKKIKNPKASQVLTYFGLICAKKILKLFGSLKKF